MSAPLETLLARIKDVQNTGHKCHPVGLQCLVCKVIRASWPIRREHRAALPKKPAAKKDPPRPFCKYGNKLLDFIGHRDWAHEPPPGYEDCGPQCCSAGTCGKGTPADVERLARAGDVIGAIKMHRAQTHASLLEAKHFVDKLRGRE